MSVLLLVSAGDHDWEMVGGQKTYEDTLLGDASGRGADGRRLRLLRRASSAVFGEVLGDRLGNVRATLLRTPRVNVAVFPRFSAVIRGLRRSPSIPRELTLFETIRRALSRVQNNRYSQTVLSGDRVSF